MSLLFFFKNHYFPTDEGGAGEGQGHEKKRNGFLGSPDLRPRYKLPVRRARVKVLERKVSQLRAKLPESPTKPQVAPEILRPEIQTALLTLNLSRLESLQLELAPLIVALEARLAEEQNLLRALEAEQAYIEQEALDLLRKRRLHDEEAILALLLAAADED